MSTVSKPEVVVGFFWLFCNNLLCTVLIRFTQELVRLCEPRGSKIEKWTGCPTDLRVAIADELFVY